MQRFVCKHKETSEGDFTRLSCRQDQNQGREWLKFLVTKWCEVTAWLLDIRSYMFGDEVRKGRGNTKGIMANQHDCMSSSISLTCRSLVRVVREGLVARREGSQERSWQCCPCRRRGGWGRPTRSDRRASSLKPTFLFC